jgi:hypothetical protein
MERARTESKRGSNQFASLVGPVAARMRVLVRGAGALHEGAVPANALKVRGILRLRGPPMGLRASPAPRCSACAGVQTRPGVLHSFAIMATAQDATLLNMTWLATGWLVQ